MGTMKNEIEAMTVSANVVVTGASSGIGKAIATRLSNDGWHVFNLDIHPPQDDELSTWIPTDLSSQVEACQSLDKVLEHGPVSGLVNNAAITGAMELLANQSEADMDQVYAVNMKAPMICSRQLIPSMKEQGFGRIVNIASRAMLGKANRTSYGGTKGALLSMSRGWAIELASAGITCNVVAPGPISTEFFQRANPPSMLRSRKIVESIPVGRIGTPDDIANTVSFFMDPRSGYITGQVLYVCGGLTLTRGGS